MLLVTTEGGLAAVTAEWGVDDVLLDTAGPAELEARIRLSLGRLAAASGSEDLPLEIRNGDLVSTRRPTPRGCATGCST